MRDLTDIYQAKQSLQESEERFRRAIMDAPLPIMLHSEDGTVLQVNHAWTEISGYTADELATLSDWTERAYGQRHEPAQDYFEQLHNLDHRQDEGEFVVQTRHQGQRIWSFSSSPLGRLNSGQRLVISMAIDVTKRKEVEKQLIHDAVHDDLTGLPNRTLFMEQLAIALKRTQRDPDYRFAVLFLDLDNFKRVNDSLGHHIGDQLLQYMADVFQNCLRQADTIARLGGDEFAMLLDATTEREAIWVASRIHEALQTSVQLEEHLVTATTSIGIVIGSDQYESEEDLLRDADIAMYQAKTSGRAGYKIFAPDMHQHVLTLLKLESDLRQAICNHEFMLEYQPIVLLKTQQPIGFEALIRWRHPSGKIIYPNDFIPTAEESGLIVPIGSWVLQEACQQIQRLCQDPFEQMPMRISINVSGKQLKSEQLLTQLDSIIASTAIPPYCLTLEITESILLDNKEGPRQLLEAIKARNVLLSIDDFGTGYSCLSYLKTFPLDHLKIDRSFISQMTQNEADLAIVRSIVDLAHHLRLEVIAEGIETEQQCDILRQIGCDYGQGSFFSDAVLPG